MDANPSFNHVRLAGQTLSEHLVGLAGFLTHATSPVSIPVSDDLDDLAVLTLLFLAYPKVREATRPAIRLVGDSSELAERVMTFAREKGWSIELAHNASLSVILSDRRPRDDGERKYWHVPRRDGTTPILNWTDEERSVLLSGCVTKENEIAGKPASSVPFVSSPYRLPWGDDIRALIVSSSQNEPARLIVPGYTE